MNSRMEAHRRLDALARGGSGQGRARLVEALSTAANAAPESFTVPAARDAVVDLLSTLLAQSSGDERRALVAALAPEPWLPTEVARRMAADALEDGAPAISAGLAARPDLGPELLRRLTEAAETSPALRAPLARNPRLSLDLAATLHAAAGAALRRELEARFPGLGASPPKATPARSPAPEGAALIGKLRAAGELGPGRLLRFLREGRLDLFQAGLIALTGAAENDVDAAVGETGGEAFARLCGRAGFDRAVLPTVSALVERLRPARERPARRAARA